MLNKSFGLEKPERLYLRDDIRRLFEQSSGSFIAYPLRVIYRVVPRKEEGRPAVSILISVAKKRFKHAVDRNRVKRLVREAYRLQKQSLVEEVGRQGVTLHFAVLMLDKELPDLKTIEIAMQRIMRRLERELKHGADDSLPKTFQSR